MSSPKPKPATAPPKKPKARPRKPTTATALEKINPDPPEVQSARNLKDQLTVKELKFLEIYLQGDLNVDEAMIAAGYTGYHPKSLYRLGRKIVEKFESQGIDRRKIARKIGAGEVTILQGLLGIAQDTKVPPGVRCRAWADLASILGLKGEITESFQGVSIIIQGEDDDPPLDIEAGPGSDAKPPIPPKPLQITR